MDGCGRRIVYLLPPRDARAGRIDRPPCLRQAGLHGRVPDAAKGSLLILIKHPPIWMASYSPKKKSGKSPKGTAKIGKDIAWSIDLRVLLVQKGNPPKIEQFMGQVSDYAYGPLQNVYMRLAEAKYEDSTAQLDLTNLIVPGEDTYCENGR